MRTLRFGLTPALLQEAEYAESRRRLLASAPLSSDDSSDGDEVDEGDGDEVALLKQEQVLVAGGSHCDSEGDSHSLAAGSARPPRRAAAAAATAKIAAELGAAAASAAAAKNTGKRRREDPDAATTPDDPVGDSGLAADGGSSDDTSDCSFPSPRSAVRASSGGESPAEGSGGDRESDAPEDSSISAKSGSDEGSDEADGGEGSPASPASPGHVVGGFSLRSRRRPVDYVALARSMYGDAAAAPGRDIDAEEGDDDWKAGRT